MSPTAIYRRGPHSLTPTPVYPFLSPKIHRCQGSRRSAPSSFFFFFSLSSFHSFIYSLIHQFIQRVPKDRLRCSPFSAHSLIWVLAALLNEHCRASVALAPQSSDEKNSWDGERGGGTDSRKSREPGTRQDNPYCHNLAFVITK